MAVTTAPYMPLESGDRLSRDEFHRRYCARPDIKKAELIDGVVYVASPTRQKFHGGQHSLMLWWLNGYAMDHPDVDVGNNSTVYISEQSEVQPDTCLFRVSPPGSLRFTEKGYLEGTPELVVEIAASSASYDLHDKMEAYRRAGVPEYIVWRVLDEQIDWFRLRDGRYARLESDEHGVIASEVFPGLRLAVPAMLAGDRAAVLTALRPSR